MGRSGHDDFRSTGAELETKRAVRNDRFMAVWSNLLLVVFDGWGQGNGDPGDAIAAASTPVMDSLARRFPSTLVDASGPAVGLPAGQMGNSEVGHMNLGAGRPVKQDLVRIDEACATGNIAEVTAWVDAITRVRTRGGRLHLLGLASDGGVHSRFEHAMALADAAVVAGVDEVVLHAFLDGRDVLPTSARAYFRAVVEPWLSARPRVTLATIVGRYFAMDRDLRWERTEQAVDLILRARGVHRSTSSEAIELSYSKNVTDEFVEPTMFGDWAGVDATNDVVVFFNFRPDRARQLTRRLTAEGVDVVTMTRYHADFGCPVLVPPLDVHDSVPEILGQQGLRHLHAAETEKYAHVTYFFAGGREDEFPGETRILVQSPKGVATYDLAPEMSARELTRRVIDAWADGFSFGIVNFANPDMVGHTGDLQATIRAVEVVDECLGLLTEAVWLRNGVLVLTADHGNAEHMLEPDGSPNTAHTTNLVPVLISDEGVTLRPTGVLSDVAPTVLSLLAIQPPGSMTARSLIV